MSRNLTLHSGETEISHKNILGKDCPTRGRTSPGRRRSECSRSRGTQRSTHLLKSSINVNSLSFGFEFFSVIMVCVGTALHSLVSHRLKGEFENIMVPLKVPRDIVKMVMRWCGSIGCAAWG